MFDSERHSCPMCAAGFPCVTPSTPLTLHTAPTPRPEIRVMIMKNRELLEGNFQIRFLGPPPEPEFITREEFTKRYEKMEPKFEVGTTVYLKSGSPAMIVAEERVSDTTSAHHGKYKCEWDDGRDGKSYNYFRPHVLTETRPELK